MKELGPSAFETLMKNRLGDLWERAEVVFENYGTSLSFDVTNVLMHAIDKDKVAGVLSALEEHYDTHLRYQHPDIKGQVSNRIENPTESMFLRICEDVLGLAPSK